VISVIVAASSVVMRAGLESLLAGHPSIAVVATSSGLPDLAQQIERHQPDAVLIEADTREEDVYAILQALTSAGGAPAIILLLDEISFQYLRAGARAVLPHGVTSKEMVAAIEAGVAGLLALHQDALQSVSMGAPTSAASARERILTAREIEVLRMLSEGLANKEIAWRLGISEHTVKFHVASLFNKLNASSRTEAVTLGVRQGLIML
jgi:DNA-binding NarL/FixJ family response regulator